MKFLDQKQTPAQTHIIGIGYEGRVTYGEGARNGAKAIIDASHHLEYYDAHTDTQPYEHGIKTFYEDLIETHPEAATKKIRSFVETKKGAFTVILGGDHAVTIGAAAAHRAKGYVAFDAHLDYRYMWNNSTHNHACVTRRVAKDKTAYVAGWRTADADELRVANEDRLLHTLRKNLTVSEFRNKLQELPGKIYVSVDVDVLDPGVIPHTGTPEPNGLTYRELLTYLEILFEHKDVEAIDFVEYAPDPEEPSTARTQSYTLAKLIYTVIGLKHK